MTDIEKTAVAPTPERVAMLKRRAELLTENPEIERAYELAPLMGAYEREYWRWVIEEGVYADGQAYHISTGE